MTEIVITGNFSNSGTVLSEADGDDALVSTGPVTANVTNSGTVTDGGGDSVHIQGLLTGTIDNTVTGVITDTSSAHNAIDIDGDTTGSGGVTGGIINAGQITGLGVVITIKAGSANITNSAGGVISGSASGIAIVLNNNALTGSTINNAGTISDSGANGFGILTYQPASATDSIINSGSISVTGGGAAAALAINGVSPAALALYGVSQISGSATVNITNSGRISSNETGSEAGGIEVFGGTATIANLSGGTISNSGAGANAIAFIGATAAGSITNAGTISQSGGAAIDDSLSGTSHTISNSGTITGNILLSPQSDVVTITGGAINGDILATAAGHGTVTIALPSGGSFTATGKMGDPAGMGLAAINLDSGTLSVNAADINASTLDFAQATAATLTLTGALTGLHATIAGWSAGSGIIDLAKVAATAATVTSADQLVVTDNGTTVATLPLSGSFTGATLSTTSDGAGGTDLSVIYSAASAVSNAQAITTPVQITDSAKDVSASLDGLQTLAAAGKLADIILTDGGIPTLSLTASQVTSDSSVISAITGYVSLDIAATGSNLSIVGPASALGNTVVFSGDASQFTVTPAGDGVHLTVTTSGSSDQLSNIQALQFSDFIEIVAPTPGSNGVVTGGNVTELYGAVFGRIPDVPGLDYYEKELAANPGLSLGTLAEDFLSSPEYTGNPKHVYAQTGPGDAQFITDSYNNLLHRAPESGAIPYYQNLIGLFTQGLTAGTAAYTAAELLAHATVLVDFSASAEFLADVQVTAQNPASAGFTGHWLVLI